jgi:hypothetical protein
LKQLGPTARGTLASLIGINVIVIMAGCPFVLLGNDSGIWNWNDEVVAVIGPVGDFEDVFIFDPAVNIKGISPESEIIDQCLYQWPAIKRPCSAMIEGSIWRHATNNPLVISGIGKWKRSGRDNFKTYRYRGPQGWCFSSVPDVYGYPHRFTRADGIWTRRYGLYGQPRSLVNEKVVLCGLERILGRSRGALRGDGLMMSLKQGVSHRLFLLGRNTRIPDSGPKSAYGAEAKNYLDPKSPYIKPVLLLFLGLFLGLFSAQQSIEYGGINAFWLALFLFGLACFLCGTWDFLNVRASVCVIPTIPETLVSAFRHLATLSSLCLSPHWD